MDENCIEVPWKIPGLPKDNFDSVEYTNLNFVVRNFFKTDIFKLLSYCVDHTLYTVERGFAALVLISPISPTSKQQYMYIVAE